MGFFRTLKILFRLLKDAPKLKAAMEAQNNTYINMTTEALASLPDDELFSAALIRVEAKIDYASDESFATLSLPQKVLYSLSTLEAEVNNGGLCQFFVNSSRMMAPYISEHLGIIGAHGHKQLYDSFIQTNGIDVNDLSSFRITKAADFEKQTERYPFDEYDDAFYALPSLQEPLTAYIKANLSAF